MRPERFYIVFRLLCRGSMMLTATSYVPSLQHMGLSLAEVDLLNAFFQASIFFMEIPTGLIADTRGRRFSLLLGILVLILGECIYGCAHGFWLALLAEVTVGIGAACLSGAEEAWLKSAMMKQFPSEQEAMEAFRRVDLYAETASRGIGAILGFVGAKMAEHGYAQTVWFVVAGCHLVLLVASVRGLGEFGEEVSPSEQADEKTAVSSRKNVRNEWSVMKKVWSDLRSNTELQVLMGPSMILRFAQPVFYTWAIFFHQHESRSLGWIWITMYSALLFGGIVARRMRQDQARMGAGLILLAAGLLFPWFSGVYAVALFLIFEFAWGFLPAYEKSLVLRRVPADLAATYRSFQSFANACVTAFVLALQWLIYHREPTSVTQIQHKLSLCAGAIVLATLFWDRKRRALLR